jgi:putative transposase
MLIWLEKKHGIKVNHKRVYRLMKCLGIKAVIRRKKKHFGGTSTIIVSDNILNRDFKSNKADTKWVTDITYLIFNGRRLYLSVILDLYNKEIVAYKVSRSNDLQLVLDTVEKATRKRNVKEILLHSDQGFQVRQEVA